MQSAFIWLDNPENVLEMHGRLVIEPTHHAEYSPTRLIDAINDQSRYVEIDVGVPVGQEAWQTLLSAEFLNSEPVGMSLRCPPTIRTDLPLPRCGRRVPRQRGSGAGWMRLASRSVMAGGTSTDGVLARLVHE